MISGRTKLAHPLLRQFVSQKKNTPSPLVHLVIHITSVLLLATACPFLPLLSDYGLTMQRLLSKKKLNLEIPMNEGKKKLNCPVDTLPAAMHVKG